MLGGNVWKKILKAAGNGLFEGLSHVAHDEDDYERMMRSRTDIVTLEPDEYEVMDIPEEAKYPR